MEWLWLTRLAMVLVLLAAFHPRPPVEGRKHVEDLLRKSKRDAGLDGIPRDRSRMRSRGMPVSRKEVDSESEEESHMMKRARGGGSSFLRSDRRLSDGSTTEHHEDLVYIPTGTSEEDPLWQSDENSTFLDRSSITQRNTLTHSHGVDVDALGRERKWYCPRPSDYNGGNKVDPPSPYWGSGWVHHGSAGVTFNHFTLNFVGGRIDVDGIDQRNVQYGVNANFYLCGPRDGAAILPGCDAMNARGSDGQFCYEMDLMEGSGSGGYCTTWHLAPEGGGGSDPTSGKKVSGVFGLKYEVDGNGCSKLYHINVDPVKPTLPSQFTSQSSDVVSPGGDNSCGISKRIYEYEQRGGLIHSTQWTGWSCDGPGFSGLGMAKASDAAVRGSTFVIRGVRYYASLVAGKEPRTCWEKEQEMHAATAAAERKELAQEQKKLRRKLEASDELLKKRAAAESREDAPTAKKVSGACCGAGDAEKREESEAEDEPRTSTR